MDDKQRVYDSIRLPHIFLGSPGACACNVYQALSPPPLEGPGYEANKWEDEMFPNSPIKQDVGPPSINR